MQTGLLKFLVYVCVCIYIVCNWKYLLCFGCIISITQAGPMTASQFSRRPASSNRKRHSGVCRCCSHGWYRWLSGELHRAPETDETAPGIWRFRWVQPVPDLLVEIDPGSLWEDDPALLDGLLPGAYSQVAYSTGRQCSLAAAEMRRTTYWSRLSWSSQDGIGIPPLLSIHLFSVPLILHSVMGEPGAYDLWL